MTHTVVYGGKRKKVYATRNTLENSFFIHGKEENCEYYDHITMYEDELQGSHLRDFREFGFAIATATVWGTGNEYLHNLWRTRYIKPAKPSPTLEESRNQVYIMAGYRMDENGRWVR